jgi:hypothetical protein
MKKYIVETAKSSVWKWEVFADSEDEAKQNFNQGIPVSKEQHITITVKEA